MSDYLHILKVTNLAIELYGVDSQEFYVARYHDAVEDGELTLLDISDQLDDFELPSDKKEEILTAIDVITRRTEDTYNDYIIKVYDNVFAKNVKVLDLIVNRFLSGPVPGDLIKRYDKALKFLLGWGLSTLFNCLQSLPKSVKDQITAIVRG